MGLRGRLPRDLGQFRGRPIILRTGYPAVRWPEHPLAVRGVVMIHRLIASEKQGRLLRSRAEVVCHLDGNRWNWSPENLVVRPGGWQLARFHVGIATGIE